MYYDQYISETLRGGRHNPHPAVSRNDIVGCIRQFLQSFVSAVGKKRDANRLMREASLNLKESLTRYPPCMGTKEAEFVVNAILDDMSDRTRTR